MVENLNLIKCHKSACKQVNLTSIILWISFISIIIPITPRLAGNQNVPTCPAHFMLLLKEQSWPAGPLLGATPQSTLSSSATRTQSSGNTQVSFLLDICNTQQAEVATKVSKITMQLLRGPSFWTLSTQKIWKMVKMGLAGTLTDQWSGEHKQLPPPPTTIPCIPSHEKAFFLF